MADFTIFGDSTLDRCQSDFTVNLSIKNVPDCDDTAAIEHGGSGVGEPSMGFYLQLRRGSQATSASVNSNIFT